MRFKLLTLGILALLLCVMTPMAVSAAPTTQASAQQKPIVGVVYTLKGNSYGPPVGVMFIRPNGNFVSVCSNLKPDGYYFVGAVLIGPSSRVVGITDFGQANTFGFLAANGNFNLQNMSVIRDCLAQGGHLVVFQGA